MVTKNGKIERWLIKQVASNLKVDSTNKEPTNQLGVGLHSSSDEWFSGVYISWDGCPFKSPEILSNANFTWNERMLANRDGDLSQCKREDYATEMDNREMIV